MDIYGLTTAEVIVVTNFSKRQLGYWVKKGYIHPNGQEPRGPGFHRCYSPDDLMYLLMIKRLRESGWSMQAINKASANLRQLIDQPKLRSIFFDGKGVLLAWCTSQEGDLLLLDALSNGGQQVMRIMLEALRQEIGLIAAQFREEVA